MKKTVIVPILLSTSVLVLAGCGKNSSYNAAMEYLDLGQYQDSINALETAIKQEPNETSYLEDLDYVKAQYAQALVTNAKNLIEGKNESGDSNKESGMQKDIAKEYYTMLNMAFEYDPTLTETLAEDKTKAKQMYEYSVALDGYSKYLTKASEDLLQILAEYRVYANALSTNTMTIQDFGANAQLLMERLLVVVQDSEKQLSKTTNGLTEIHKTYLDNVRSYYEAMRNIVALVNQNEIDVEVVLAPGEVVQKIPDDYVTHLTSVKAEAQSFSIAFPENIDEKIFEGTGDKKEEKE